MREASTRAVRFYKSHPRFKGGKGNIAAPNTLNCEFIVDKPNSHWVTDFTYIRTYEGWLYLAVVIVLFSRRIVGWTIKSSSEADLVIYALLIAV